MNTCPSCHKDNIPLATFCGNCGGSLSHSGSVSVPPAGRPASVRASRPSIPRSSPPSQESRATRPRHSKPVPAFRASLPPPRVSLPVKTQTAGSDSDRLGPQNSVSRSQPDVSRYSRPEISLADSGNGVSRPTPFVGRSSPGPIPGSSHSSRAVRPPGPSVSPNSKPSLEESVDPVNDSLIGALVPFDPLATPGSQLFGHVVDGKYAIDSVIGEGGMGIVYHATDIVTQMPVVVKAIRAEYAYFDEFRSRIITEGRVLARIDHHNVVRLNAVVVEPHRLFLVMQYVDGESLDKTIERYAERRTLMPIDVVFRVFSQILAGVGAAHEEGVIHRDIKPANILIRKRDMLVKVSDFGVAKLEEDIRSGKHRTTKGLVGSVHYMAPEQIMGDHDLDHRVDIYALGTVLYEMLTGVHPFEGPSDFATMRMHLDLPIPPVSDFRDDVPSYVDEAIGKACAKDREHRFPSTTEMAAALRIGSARAQSFAPPSVRKPLPSTPFSRAPLAEHESSSNKAVQSPSDLIPTAPLPDVEQKRVDVAPMDPTKDHNARVDIASLVKDASQNKAQDVSQNKASTPDLDIEEPGLSERSASLDSEIESALPDEALFGIIPSRQKQHRVRDALIGIIVGIIVLAIIYAIKQCSSASNQANSVLGVATTSVPIPTESVAPLNKAPDNPLEKLEGGWSSENGRKYVAQVRNGKLRFMLLEGLPDYGYKSGDTRFELTAIPDKEHEFLVTDYVRPWPPKGTSFAPSALDSCIATRTVYLGEPLTAKLFGTVLEIQHVRVSPPHSAFVRVGNTIEACKDLNVLTEGESRVASPFSRDP